MNVRAKFTCILNMPTDNGHQLKFIPVTTGSEENERFFKYTPWGTLEIGTINEAAAAAFEVGKEYFLDLSPA